MYVFFSKINNTIAKGYRDRKGSKGGTNDSD